jgi:hypothetical protein
MQYIIGSISHATMRAEDLIPVFVDTARELGSEDPALDEIEARMEDEDYFDSEDAYWDLDTLFDILSELAPPYFYFGSHPGDGSDYGFWLSEDALTDLFDGLRVSDTAKVPEDYEGEVLHVNDHGNTSLYTAHKGKLTEIWAIV